MRRAVSEDREARFGPFHAAIGHVRPLHAHRLVCRLLTAASLVMSLVVATTAAGRSVTFRTDDGVTLAGTWYEPSARAGPAVVLVHMLHRSRRDWDALAMGLASEGIGVLAFDLRGHGESIGTIPPDGQFAPFQQDLAAARRFVASRGDVITHRVGVAGASLGAAIAAIDAAQNAGVQSLALLSASTEYRGLRIDGALKKYSGRALLVYSDDDPYAQRSARDLIKLPGSNPSTRETLALHHAGHGTAMLAADPTLLPALVDWFKRTL